MKEKAKQTFKLGGVLLAVFALWTVLIQCVDVRPAGQNGTNIGFAALNVSEQEHLKYLSKKGKWAKISV